MVDNYPSKLVAELKSDLARRWRADRTCAEDYLAKHPELRDHPDAVIDLLMAEIKLSEDSGLAPRWDDYEEKFRDVFPELVRQWHFDAEMLDERRPWPDIPGFIVLGEIGRGGIGVVYRAYSVDRKAVVALKTLNDRYRTDSASINRFGREFRLLAKIYHSTLVQLFDFFDEPIPFFTLEYVKGDNLLDYSRRILISPGSDGEPASPKLRVSRLLPVLKEFAQGLRFLHDNGVFHRDIKPSHVTVTPDGHVKILDFGLSARLPAETRVGLDRDTVILGLTREYASPERLAGLMAGVALATPEDDWFGWGMTVFEALTGSRPARIEAESEPPRPSQLVLGIPPELDDLCARLLRFRPADRPPGDEVLAVLDRLLGRPIEERRRAPDLSTFIRRDAYLGDMEAEFREVKRGKAIILYLYGGSGVGKSTLFHRFLTDLGRSDALVFAGECFETYSGRYNGIRWLFEALRRHLNSLGRAEVKELLPDDAPSLLHLEEFDRVDVVREQVSRDGVLAEMARQDPYAQQRSYSAFSLLLKRLAREQFRAGRPLVLGIEDMQWGDDDSAALLAEVLNSPDPPILLLVGCIRGRPGTSPVLRALQKLRKGPKLRFVGMRVRPLAFPESKHLALMLLGRDAEGVDSQAEGITSALAETIANQSGGIPLFIEELVSYVRTGAKLDEGITLGKAQWANICRLTTQARSLLEVVALAGEPIWWDDAYRAASLEPAEGLKAETALRKLKRIISTVTSGRTARAKLLLYHGSIRKTIEANLSPDETRARYQSLAAALQYSEHIQSPMLRAHYHLKAGDEKRAAELLEEAADTAGTAYKLAVRCYNKAYKLCRTDSRKRHQLRVKLARALANDGRGAAAAKRYLASTATARDEDEALKLRHWAAEQYLISGHVDEGLQIFREVLEAVGMRLPSTPLQALVSLYARRAYLRLRGIGFRPVTPKRAIERDLMCIDICWSATGLSVIDPIRGADFQVRSLHLALHVGEPYRIARALAAEATHLASAGWSSIPRARHFLREAAKWADSVQDADTRRHAHGTVSLAKGVIAYLDGRWQEARESCDKAEHIFSSCPGSCDKLEDTFGVIWERNTAQVFSFWALTYQGKVAELKKLLPKRLREAKQRNDHYARANLCSYIMALVMLAEDDIHGAIRALEETEGLWTKRGFHVQHHNFLIARVLINLYRGSGLEAFETVLAAWANYKTSYLYHVEQLFIEFLTLRGLSAASAAANGSVPDEYASDAEMCARRLGRIKTSRSSALALLIRAGVAGVRRDTPAAIELLHRAVTRLDTDEVDLRLHAQAARYRLGELIGGEEGQALIGKARDWMKDQGIRNQAAMAAMYTPSFPR